MKQDGIKATVCQSGASLLLGSAGMVDQLISDPHWIFEVYRRLHEHTLGRTVCTGVKTLTSWSYGGNTANPQMTKERCHFLTEKISAAISGRGYDGGRALKTHTRLYPNSLFSHFQSAIGTPIHGFKKNLS